MVENVALEKEVNKKEKAKIGRIGLKIGSNIHPHAELEINSEKR